MYLISYAGRTVIHDGSVEGPDAKPIDPAAHEKGWKYRMGMPSTMVPIRNVPTDVHRQLKARAAEIIRAERA